MRRYVTEIKGKHGMIEDFGLPQTPQLIADETARRLTASRYLTGVKRYSLLVWALPEGARHIDDVPRSSPARATYIQCGGSTEAMTIEIRVTHDDDSYSHYVVAREPVTDPKAWTTVSWDNGNPEPYTIQVHPQEVFTGEQAVPVFRAYIEDNALPPADLLRRIDV
ncbi:NTP pyrophosphohydrolase [Actinomyces naeslundii]|nr:NTP pyrophosphohydrolase [Actinomyces naeslundii]OLO92924.1 NTP pyrophosphohydrolase [Actinomyces naeslundii]